MTQTTATLRVRIIPPTEKDWAAIVNATEEHLRKYGPEPAPHLRHEAEKDRDRIIRCAAACYDYELETIPS